MAKIRVLIIDDSAFMRKALENMIKKDDELEIVGFGKNGEEAIQMVADLKPDIMTLDIEMPRLDGLSALERIMRENPLPVIMVSSLTQEGADATLRALELGAVDFIPKDKSFASFGILKIEEELLSKIKSFARRKMQLRRFSPIAKEPTPEEAKVIETPVVRKVSGIKAASKAIVAIGTSTGGPQSLQKVIPNLPGDLGVPILVVQHMPPNFTASLAARLNTLSQLTVVEAQGKEHLEKNTVYIAKGGMHLKIRKMGNHHYTEVTDDPKDILHIPSVDVMTASVAEHFGGDSLGVIMTGMGHDGLKGMQLMKLKGGAIIAQEEHSCIVYGMPRAVVEAGIADDILPLDDIAGRVTHYTKK